MPSNLNVSVERSFFSPQPHHTPHQVISGVLVGDQIIRDLISEIGVLFFYFLLICPCKNEKQKQKKDYLKPSQHEQKPKEEKNWSLFLIYCVGLYTDL